MKKWGIKGIAVTISLSIFLQAALGARAEANLWSDRKLAMAAQPALSLPPLPLPTLTHAVATPLPRLSAKPTVIHIQDIHLNTEAQTSISETIRAYAGQNKITTVALEGAFGPIDLAALRAPSQKEYLIEAADYLLGSNQLAGAMHAALTTENLSKIVGVDDERHYNANAQAYRDSRAVYPAVKANLAREKEKIEREKQTAT
jgi:hypothetical protein